MSIAIVAAVFGLLALLALFFAGAPVLRAKGIARGSRVAVAALATLAVLGAGGGLYVLLGSPSLALRSVAKPKDIPSLIAELAHRARAKNFDSTGFTLLARGYLSLGDAPDAAAAFRRAAERAPPDARPGLMSAYGEALTMAASGSVTPEAESAFRAALAGNPKDPAAQYYLGLAFAERGDNVHAIALWQTLLAQAPPDAPWRRQIVDRLAALHAQGVAPDIGAMVARLAARLKADPDDAEGWQRLVRAYAVLGQKDKARAALADARTALRNNRSAIAALDNQAKALQLEP